MGGLRSVLDDSFSWKWKLRGNCGEVSCTEGNWGFHLFMHSKQIYEPRETFEILLSPKIIPLPIKPFLSYYPLKIPRVWTMGYKDNTFDLVFPCVSQGPLLKTSKEHIKVLGPWCSSCYISSDRDPYYMSSGLTKILFFFLYYYYYYFFLFSFFLGLWAFMVLLNFIN